MRWRYNIINCKVEIIKYPSDEDWRLVKESALETMGKSLVNLPDDNYKMRLLLSEHSPIRNLIYMWKWIDLPSWVSVHFVRHKIGIEHFVRSQRNDRQKDYDRNEARQDYPVTHRVTANAQAILNISQKRLCYNASKETREAWELFLNTLTTIDKSSTILKELCVPTCIYRGGICTEPFSCGYCITEKGHYNITKYYLMTREYLERKK